MRSVSSARVSEESPPTSCTASRRNAPAAPGIVEIEPQVSCTRRSTLKPTTYSRCCIRGIRRSRLAILTLPATAPIAGSANGATSCATVSGWKIVSPSIMTMRSCFAAGHAAVERLGLAGVGLPHDAHAGQGEVLEQVGGAVGGAVVDHHDLEGMVVGEDRADGRLDVLGLVVGGHDHRHGVGHRLAPRERRVATTLRVPAGHHQHHDQPGDHQAADADQRDLHQGDDALGDADRGQQALPHHAVAGRRGLPVGAEARGVAHGGEPVPLGLQLRDQPVEGGDGLRAVAAGVVQQHRRARAVLRGRVADDRVDAGALPVLAVDVGEHRDVALAAGGEDGAVARVVEGVRGRGERRAHEVGGDAGRAGDRQLGVGDLAVAAQVGHAGEVGVGEGVDADLGARRDDPLGHVGVPGDHRADDEERAGHPVALQYLEDLRGPHRVGAVVEREGDGAVGQSARAHRVGAGVDDRAAGADRRRHGVVALGARARASLPMQELTRPETVSTVSTISTRTPVIVQMPHRRLGAVDRVLLVVTMRHPLPPHRDTTVS